MGYRFRSKQFPSTQVSAWFPNATRTRLANFNFLPSDIPSLQLWLDAADLTTITESSGSVTQWNDKSGNGYDVTQGTAARRPVTGTRTLNGRNVIDFDGSDDNLNRQTSMGLWQNITGGTLYFVSVYDISPTTPRILFYIRRNNTVAMAGNSPGTKANKYNAGGRTDAAQILMVVNSTNDIPAGTGIIQSSVFDIANTDLFIYVNGVLQGTNTSYQTTSTTDFESNRLEVGSRVDSTAAINGTIGEILVYHTAHTAEQRQAVESYLKTKWNV